MKPESDFGFTLGPGVLNGTKPPVLVFTTTRNDRAITLGRCQNIPQGHNCQGNDDLNSTRGDFTGKAVNQALAVQVHFLP